jgi:UDP-2,3-diacylglucosamine pyrophosphatase LpxH
MSTPSKRYQRAINKALDEAYRKAAGSARPIALDEAQIMIFSDLHKGVRDGADDFIESETPYHTALAHYFQLGFTLIVNGDVEELWENDPEPVLDAYRTTLELEREFHDTDRRYWRTWGNHDDDWSILDQVKAYLWDTFSDLQVPETILLTVQDGDEELGQILLLHGHQGTLFSDRLSGFSRCVVRTVVRNFQRLTGINPNTPSRDWDLRRKHNIALYNWAVKQPNLILIAGHTHRPVFSAIETTEQLAEALESAPETMGQAELAERRAELDYARVRETQQGFKMKRPSYFNSGCCCYSNGEITGLEIQSGNIILVRWPDQNGVPIRKQLVAEDLRRIFRSVADVGALIETEDVLPRQESDPEY